MSRRAESLANRIEEGADTLAAFVEGLKIKNQVGTSSPQTTIQKRHKFIGCGVLFMIEPSHNEELRR